MIFLHLTLFLFVSVTDGIIVFILVFNSFHRIFFVKAMGAQTSLPTMVTLFKALGGQLAYPISLGRTSLGTILDCPFIVYLSFSCFLYCFVLRVRPSGKGWGFLKGANQVKMSRSSLMHVLILIQLVFFFFI